MSGSASLVFTDLKWFLRITTAMFVFVAMFILETADERAVFPIRQTIQAEAGGTAIETIEIASLNLSVWVAFLLLVSAASYFVLSTTGFGWYIRNLKHRLNFMRWLHHSVSTSLMITITALVSGLNELLSLLLIFLLAVVFNMFGFLMEIYNEKRKRIIWHSYVIGLIVMLSGWLLMLGTFLVSKFVLDVPVSGSEIWLYAIVSAFLGMFSLNMMLHYQAVGPWKDYVFDEKSYVLINFIAKTTFALVLYQAFLV